MKSLNGDKAKFSLDKDAIILLTSVGYIICVGDKRIIHQVESDAK